VDESLKEKMNCKEDIEAMFSGEELSEDFKLKATTIFEAAVIARAVEVVEQLEADILASAEETVDYLNKRGEKLVL
jgi:SHS2 domain-containing protein